MGDLGDIDGVLYRPAVSSASATGAQKTEGLFFNVFHGPDVYIFRDLARLADQADAAQSAATGRHLLPDDACCQRLEESLEF